MADQERTGVVTMRGNPLTLIGPALKPGDKAPDFQALAQELFRNAPVINGLARNGHQEGKQVRVQKRERDVETVFCGY